MSVNIKADYHAASPAIDLRSAIGFWVSHELPQSIPFRRIACIEMLGSGVPVDEALRNVFAGLLLLEAKRIPVKVIAMPLLGTGAQMLPAEQLAGLLVGQAQEYLERSTTTDRLLFFEIAPGKAHLVSNALDSVLGRQRVTLPRQQLEDALLQDVQQRLRQANTLFLPDCDRFQKDLLSLLQKGEVRSVEFGVHARKFVELLVERLGAPQGSLANRIRAIETAGKIAPWVCGYMHVLRHLGNEVVHENHLGVERIPSVISPGDLTTGLFCLLRLLDFWCDLASKGPIPNAC